MHGVLGVVSWLAALATPVGYVMGMPVPVHSPQARIPVIVTQVPATQRLDSSLQRQVSVQFRDVPLRIVLAEIDRQAHLGLTYTSEVVPLERHVTLERSNITAGAALREVLRGMAVAVEVARDGRISLVKAGRINSAGAIRGRITDAKTAAGIAGAEVLLDGTRWGTTTDSSGSYRIENVDAGTYVLIARRLGYAKQSRHVTVLGDGQDTVDLALEPVAARLDELVTTATGRRRRRDIANDITTLNADSIVRTQPITSVTDLLEGRVPGLTVQRTSGAPGDPARLRLRGAGSPLRSNDPIVVVDGVRVYAEQSAARSANLAGIGDTTRDAAKNAYATPSPLDYIDPNTIETIEVIKGPSAATLYGQDAANGVIVITTKKGKAGPTRWQASVDHGRSRIAGDFPELLLRWGHPLGSNLPVGCRIDNTISATIAARATGAGPGAPCEGDSLVKFQLLNDPALTALDRGHRTALTLGASGGTQALTYAVTGSYQEELGLPKLPSYEAERYQARIGTPPPDWMQRPQHLTQWGVTNTLGARLGAAATVSLSSRFSRTAQQRSSLEQQLGTLMSTYLDRASGIYYQPYGSALNTATDIVTSYYEQATATATSFTNGLNLDWRLRPWLTLTGDAGLDLIQRADEIFLPRGAAMGLDSVGRFDVGHGTTLTSTVNVRANALAPLGRGFAFRFAAGVNYTGTSTNDLSSQTSDLVAGSHTRGASITGLTPNVSDVATFGWYAAPSIGNSKFNLDAGLRFDGGTGTGGGVSGFRLPSFPKLGFSYLLSDEPFFPFKDLIQSFRLRFAYGRASRQPGITDRLRLYGPRLPVYQDGQYVSGVFLATLGNTEVRPERSSELEGGLDVDLWNSRLNVVVTGYRKTTDDALLSVPLAPSVYGSNIQVMRNIGMVRNTGLELSIDGQWVRSGPVVWRTMVSLSRNRNLVVKLGPGVQPFAVGEGIRVVPGYPLFGRWSRPILGYADLNGDGVLQDQEVQMGDTAVYVGQTEPDYTLGLQTTLSLWNRALEVSAGLQRDGGLTQKNEVRKQLALFTRGWNVPGVPLAEQAAAVNLSALQLLDGGFDTGDYNWMQTISTTRLQSLSVRYRMPASMARWLRAEQLHVAVQGTNLGLWTNYRGMDPNVNAFSTGNNVADTGILPQPRTWQLRVDATY